MTQEDWERILRLGVFDHIKTPVDYENACLEGIREYRELAKGDFGVIRPSDFLLAHETIFKDIHSWAGQHRQPGEIVWFQLPRIGRVDGLDAEKIPEKLQGILEQQIEYKSRDDLSEAEKHEMIAKVYCELVASQPFLDGNKRVAQEIAFQQIQAEFDRMPLQPFDRDWLLKSMTEYCVCDEHGKRKEGIKQMVEQVGTAISWGRSWIHSQEREVQIQAFLKAEAEKNQGHFIVSDEREIYGRGFFEGVPIYRTVEYQELLKTQQKEEAKLTQKEPSHDLTKKPEPEPSL